MKFRERREREINAMSITAAMGWSGLFNGLAGEDGTKVSPLNLLPFGQTEAKPERLSPATKAIIDRLVDRKQLPPMLHNAFYSLLQS